MINRLKIEMEGATTDLSGIEILNLEMNGANAFRGSQVCR